MNLYYRIKNTISYFWYNLRARYQRSKRGYSYGDVWNMYDWFMGTVKPMLIHLKNEGMGYPGEFKDRSEQEAILDEMIDCLDFMDEDKVYALFGFCEIDDYKRMTKEDHQRIYKTMEENKNRFFELFSKYYFDLWD